jgi:hypothetical protein
MKSRIALFAKSPSNFNGFGVVCYRPRVVKKDNSHLVEEGFLLVSSDPREEDVKGSEHLTLIKPSQPRSEMVGRYSTKGSH